MLDGQLHDISWALHFHFYEPVYFKDHGKASFSSSTGGRLGYWVGIDPNCGCWEMKA